MSIKNKFTIRPKLIKGESLTSYLVRVAHVNQISFSELWKLVEKNDIYSVNRYFANKFDLYPSSLIDIKRLSKLLKMSSETLELHTFEPFINLFYSDAGEKMIFSKEINLKHRKYCKTCLSETGAFNLLWQVKEITICDKHFTRLKSRCENCGREQPYLPKNMGYLKCCCGESLLNGSEKKEQEDNLLNKQLRIYRDWNYLISLQINKNTLPNLQHIKRKIAITLLYITFSGRYSISSRKNTYLTRNQVKKLVEISRGNSGSSIVLNGLLNSIRDLNIEVEDILEISVPVSYVKLVLGNKKTESSKPRCNTPWCKSFGSKSSMKNLRRISSGKYIPKTNLYKQHHICVDCWIQMGLHKKRGTWTEVNLSIPLLTQILKLIENGLSVNTISAKLKLDYYKVVMYLGYLYRFNLIQTNNTIIKRINNNEILDFDLVPFFIELKPFWKNYQTLFRKSSKFFSWSPLETFYYYWSSEVQQLLYLEMNIPITRVEVRDELLKSVKNILNELEATNSKITVEMVAASLQLNKNVLYYHNTYHLIKETNKRIQSISKTKEGKKLVNSINNFVSEKKNKNLQIYKKDIYKYLRKSPSYINNNHPKVQTYIHNITEKSKFEQKVLREEKIKGIIYDSLETYGRLDVGILSECLGVSEETLKSGYYRIINQQKNIKDESS